VRAHVKRKLLRVRLSARGGAQRLVEAKPDRTCTSGKQELPTARVMLRHIAAAHLSFAAENLLPCSERREEQNRVSARAAQGVMMKGCCCLTSLCVTISRAS